METEVDDRTRLHMPLLIRAELTGFSLYSQRRQISVEINSGVFCLAGANGLGKSTFLSALSFGLTGTVAPERPTFNSLPQYYARCLAYSRDYYDGRIKDHDRDAAEISLTFSVGNKVYRIRRNPFELEALRYLHIETSDGQVVIDHSDGQSDEERHEIYVRTLTAGVGLSSFSQFVFLHHYLLTFDERRQTLFWDEASAEKVLYLALGLDPDLAKTADELRKRADAQDSLARNAQYDATIARNRLREIQASRDEVDSNAENKDEQELESRLKKAEQELAQASQFFDDTFGKLGDARLGLASASANELRAREDYERVFKAGFAQHESPSQHPLIVELIQSEHCPICATTGVSVVERIKESLSDSLCPLCSSSIEEPDANENFAVRARQLQLVDEVLTKSRDDLQKARQRVERLEKTAGEAKLKFEAASTGLHEIERLVSASPAGKAGDKRAGLEHLEQQIQATIDDAIARKETHRKRRDEALAGLKPLRQKLLDAFYEAELELAPLFQDLAMQFLGLPLDITLSPSNKEHVKLLLTVKSERRRTGNQLSESQRYFLDIALRMALVMHMSAPGSPAPLYIDTPEGSLDIAYESRAGSMFAKFAGNGHPIAMTANINTSQLLLRLAEECGTERMTLVRMTDWTSLSDVQAAEEDRIEAAYQAIEAALGSGGATSQVTQLVGKAHG